jgi:MFS family permease
MVDEVGTATVPPSNQAASSLGPFRHRNFAVLWIATVVANVGTWMQSAAAGWLMTTLNPDPFVVSLVQVASSLPMFIFAVPAGALADVLDRRRLLVVLQLAGIVLSVILGVLVLVDLVTPITLLTFLLLIATAAGLIMPAWQSVVPQLVPKGLLNAAITLNSAGVNVSRAIGPALAGLVIAAWGLGAPFIVNAIVTLGVVAALIWWHPPQDAAYSNVPPERFTLAIGAGLRYARHNPHLRATLICGLGFFLSASSYWALLPLIARNQLAGGPEFYGLLLAAIGLGAVASTFALPLFAKALGPDRLAAVGALGTAVALVLFALSRVAALALTASVIAGAAWIIVLTTLNVSAQVALPSWVRGRGLSIFNTVMFGSMTAGSALWGKLAGLAGLPVANLVASLGVLITIPLLWRWKLQTGAALDLNPSQHWPAPVLSHEISEDQGPVLVTVEYEIDPQDRAKFLEAMRHFAGERRRDGAFAWGIFEKVAETGRFVEIFMLNSWAEHLRQHERVTDADRKMQEVVKRFQIDGDPKVTHSISAI